MSNTTEKTRNLGVDILCCLGAILLLGLQYFDCIGFSDAPVNHFLAALPIAARWFCLSGAMLLAAGTGYVLSTRTYTNGHFKILFRLLYVYLACSAAGLLIRMFLLQEPFTWQTALQSLFDFTSTETSRFAGMYFALLIAAPFLNAAFHGLKHRQARQAFLVVAALVSTLQPTLYFGGIYILPTWCKGLFPIAAYIGGAYIRRYSKRKDWLSLLIFMLSLCIAQTVVVLSVSMAEGVLYCPWLDSMASLPCLCIAMCLLSLFRSRKEGNRAVHRFFGGAAGAALGALLIADPLLDCLLPALQERFPSLEIALLAGLAVVPMTFILCCGISLLLQLPFLLIRQGIRGGGVEEETEETEETEASEETEAAAEEAVETEEAEAVEAPPVETTQKIFVSRTEAEAAAAYEEDAYEEEDDAAYEEISTVPQEPVEVHTAKFPAPVLPKTPPSNSRHTIAVPIPPTEQVVRLTQPAEELPIGAKPAVRQPVSRVRDYTLDEILSEQGIAVKRKTDTVEDLIAELTTPKN